MEPKQAYQILSSKVNLEDNVKKALLDVIKTDPETTCNYIAYVLRPQLRPRRNGISLSNERCSVVESVIKTYPRYVFYYAAYFLEERWPEAEEYVKTDPTYACLYARDVIKGRFPEAEPYIKTNPEYAYRYAEEVIKDENFWENQVALEEFMNNMPKSKSNNELDALKKQREELDNKIKQLMCVN